ncbi:MAG: PilZ domain-containing protein [Rubrobacteridae bacterium]|nr:PilZ domain-containing protein [Rubrobacteridae bacterium]
MKDINSILYLGKVIKLVDADDNSWECGISKFIKEYQIICELLSNASILDSMVASHPYEFIQGREYYRLVEPNLEVECMIHGELHETSALDLAGGGIGLMIDRERNIKRDTLLELRITLPDGKSLQIGARATHVVPTEKPGKYIVGAYFSKISSADESKIMKHIFCEQIRKSKEARQTN